VPGLPRGSGPDRAIPPDDWPVLAWKHITLRPTLCRDCGIAVGNDVSRRSLLTGWWGIFAPIVNVLTLRRNAREIRRLRRLPAPGRTALEYRK
jgi:hypothetical protein